MVFGKWFLITFSTYGHERGCVPDWHYRQICVKGKDEVKALKKFEQYMDSCSSYYPIYAIHKIEPISKSDIFNAERTFAASYAKQLKSGEIIDTEEFFWIDTGWSKTNDGWKWS